MGETTGRVSIRTLHLDDKVFTETRSSVSDSDNNIELLKLAAELNVALGNVLVKYHSDLEYIRQARYSKQPIEIEV